jgi:pimeloyl-ACP methyl ester carboxylesterase
MTGMNSVKLDRRLLLKGGVAAGAAAVLASPASVTPAMAALPENQFKPVPMPPLPPFKEGIAEIPGTKLYYRDFGGDGVPLVLMHPATGSAIMWGYQIPAFVKAGYRVIAYSRRGYYKSETVADKNNAGQPSTDLRNLMDKLGIGKFAAVATAAGCTITLDFAMDHSDRLHAIVLSSGALGNLEEPEYRKVSDFVRTKGLEDMPPEFRELGPAYRGSNVEGTKEWLDLEHKAINGNRLGPTNVNKFTWATLARVKCPTLFIAGGSDLAAPPTMMRIAAERIANADMVIAPNTGHSVYWEQPDFFNNAVLDFLGRHVKKG